MSTNGPAVGERAGSNEQVSVIGKMIVESQTLDEDGKEMVSGLYTMWACQTVRIYLHTDCVSKLPGHCAVYHAVSGS